MIFLLRLINITNYQILIVGEGKVAYYRVRLSNSLQIILG